MADLMIRARDALSNERDASHCNLHRKPQFARSDQTRSPNWKGVANDISSVRVLDSE
jgi:hypothetical protein